jgi:hypothetical protein
MTKNIKRQQPLTLSLSSFYGEREPSFGDTQSCRGLLLGVSAALPLPAGGEKAGVRGFRGYGHAASA